MLITPQQAAALMCLEDAQVFRARCPEGLEATVENCLRHALHLDWHRLAPRLSPTNYRRWKRAIQPLRLAYEAAHSERCRLNSLVWKNGIDPVAQQAAQEGERQAKQAWVAYVTLQAQTFAQLAS